MNKNQQVYCTNCFNFRLCDEGLPYCIHENKCDINDCDDSKAFKERPHFESYTKDMHAQKKEVGVDVTMVNKKSWQEFRDTGLLWWINMVLHTFGWAIALDIDEETREVTNSYPARVRYRGFDEDNNTLGYQKVSKYLKDNVEEIEKESLE